MNRPNPSSTQSRNLISVASALLFVVVLKFALGLSWFAATGLTTLIIIHEFGHLVTIWHYGIKCTPPMFMFPFGALITLEEPVKEESTEAWIALGGPILGTMGALLPLPVYLMTGDKEWLSLVEMGLVINLLNLLPFGTLDGGRVIGAIMPGIRGLLVVLALVAAVVLNWSILFLIACFSALELPKENRRRANLILGTVIFATAQIFYQPGSLSLLVAVVVWFLTLPHLRNSQMLPPTTSQEAAVTSEEQAVQDGEAAEDEPQEEPEQQTVPLQIGRVKASRNLAIFIGMLYFGLVLALLQGLYLTALVLHSGS